MYKATLHVANVTVRTHFEAAKPLHEAKLDEFARAALIGFGGYGLRAPQIRLNAGDRLYNYDLEFSLFGGNSVFRVNSERLEIQIQNIRTDEDAEVVRTLVLKGQECLGQRPRVLNVIELQLHAALPSEDDRNRYLAGFNHGIKEVTSGGVIAYKTNDSFKSEARFTVDRSLVIANGVYVTWEVGFVGNLGKQHLEDAGKDVTEFFRLFGLGGL